MKQNNNNEIDLLLRSLGKGERGKVPLDNVQVSRPEPGTLSNHLDADELSSFAEGVMPARARARYIAHIADCGSCRSTVIGLTQASGASIPPERFQQQTGSSIWLTIVGLFSLPVLRYGFPALVLTAVIIISFFALREQRHPDLVAQVDNPSSAAPVPVNQSQSEQPVGQSNSPESRTGTPRGNEFQTGLDSGRERKLAKGERTFDDRAAPGAEPDAPTGTASNTTAPTKQGYAAGGVGSVLALEPKAAPPPPASKPALSAADKSGTLQKEQVSKREVQPLPYEEEKNQPREERGRNGSSRTSAPLASTRRAEGIATDRVDTQTKSKKDSDDEVETRTIAGRRFRRQGNAWVDIAYDSTRGATTVSRGSERFRALIADEPGIRTIAEKLNGVVIVVWSGRAYRIQ